MFRSQSLSVSRMIELENWIDSLPPEIHEALNDEKLSTILKLKVEYVDKRSMPENVEAQLCPIAETDYFGLIKLNRDLQNERFSYMHEIIHYLRDVGLNNRVDRIFTRKIKGKTESIEEQETNYLAAAATIPYQDMEKQIYKYDHTKPKMDEVIFVHSLCEKYGQSRVAVLRRVREVRRIQKSKRAKA